MARYDSAPPPRLWELLTEIHEAVLQAVPFEGEALEDFKKELLTYSDPDAPVVKFRSVLRGESDRGTALVGAAYLEDQLERAIRATLVDTPHVDNLFDNRGPLGTFSAKIEMGFALGLVSKDARRDLTLIRKIRNAYAHSPLR